MQSSAARALEFDSGSVAGVAGLGNPITGDADAMEWNPAALGENKYMFQFIVTPISARLKTDDWSVESVIRLLNGQYTAAERSALIDALENDDLVGSVNLSGGAHLALQGNGVGASVRGYSDVAVSADTARLLLVGGEEGEIYHLAGTEGRSSIVGDVRLASVYSDPWLAKVLHIAGFHMGGTLRYLHGLQYVRAEALGDTVQITKDGDALKATGDGRLAMWQSQTGWGAATDLGLLIRLTPGVAVDASITDLGIMCWGDIEQVVYSYQVDPDTGVGSFVSSAAVDTDLRPREPLPAKLRVGLSAANKNGFIWSLRYAKRLMGEQADTEEWALSMQLNRWAVLPLRLAAKYDAADEELTFAFGLGIHLGPLVLDVGTSNLTGLLNRAKDASISVSTGLRF